jgi:hypothetical protein
MLHAPIVREEKHCRSSAQGGGDEVDGRLAPAGALDDEGPAPPLHGGSDRLDLAVTELGAGVGGEAAQQIESGPLEVVGHGAHRTGLV